jgi:hypothetical protein
MGMNIGRLAMRIPNLDKIGSESAGFALAELASMGVSLGVVGVMDSVAPETQKKLYKTLGKVVFEPILDNLEWGLSKICRLEECKIDTTKSKEERAEQWARTTVIFGAAWAAAMGTKKWTRAKWNKAVLGDGFVQPLPKTGSKLKDFMQFDNHEQVIFGLDEGVHYGSLLLMNTAAAPVTDDMIRSSKSVLMKCGVGERKAQELSDWVMIWELPNLLGMAAGIAGIAGIHNKQWDQKWANFKEKKFGWKQPKLGFVERLHDEAHAKDMIPNI